MTKRIREQNMSVNFQDRSNYVISAYLAVEIFLLKHGFAFAHRTTSISNGATFTTTLKTETSEEHDYKMVYIFRTKWFDENSPQPILIYNVNKS